jgi:large subunit ribosomal protein L21
MYAIVRTGGKQYTVKENDVIQVEKLDVLAGEEVILSDVLLVSGDDGEVIGTPVVEGATVVCKVQDQGLGKKIIGRTYKPKQHTSKRYGHRQPYTQILIEKIAYKKPRAKKAAEEPAEAAAAAE